MHNGSAHRIPVWRQRTHFLWGFCNCQCVIYKNIHDLTIHCVIIIHIYYLIFLLHIQHILFYMYIFYCVLSLHVEYIWKKMHVSCFVTIKVILKLPSYPLCPRFYLLIQQELMRRLEHVQIDECPNV